jgi:hypothetical protein
MKARARLFTAGPVSIVGSCFQCHGLRYTVQQRKVAAEWSATVNDMVARGAQISEDEADLITSYLAENLSPESDWLPHCLVLHHRGAREHAQSAELRQVADQSLGHPICEVLLERSHASASESRLLPLEG